MQTDVSEGAHSELQFHLYSLLEIKRNRLQRNNSDVFEVASESKQLTADELRAGGWWCADTSEDALKAFILSGLINKENTHWDGSFYGCFLYEIGSNLIDRGFRHHTEGLKQIHRIGNEFYWS